ncbi:MAG: site-specific DNA-methyltransferase [Chthoniobacterales bacterium]|nr:site-specific DNA-methyltransferase [Chthoniobacterales bacterium]
MKPPENSPTPPFPIQLNTIHIGDALTYLPLLPDNSIQAIVADPPYFRVLNEPWDNQWQTFNDYLQWTLSWLNQAMRALRSDGLLFLFGQIGKREHGFLHVLSAATQLWKFHDLIIWDRVVGYNERRDSLTPAYELILLLRKNKPKFHKHALRIPYDPSTIARYLRDKRYKNPQARAAHLAAGKFATNILRIPSLKGSSREKCGHPTQKPLALIQALLLLATDPNDIVLDPFLGSGTTALAARNLGRFWLGFEIHPPYAQLALSRLNNSQPQSKFAHQNNLHFSPFPINLNPLQKT